MAAALAVGALLILTSPVAARAAEATNVLTLTPGPLTISGTTAVTVGTQRDGLIRVALSAGVMDERGTGGGWSLVLTTSRPTQLTVVASTRGLELGDVPGTMPTVVNAGPDSPAVLWRAAALQGSGSDTVTATIEAAPLQRQAGQVEVWTLELIPDIAR